MITVVASARPRNLNIESQITGGFKGLHLSEFRWHTDDGLGEVFAVGPRETEVGVARRGRGQGEGENEVGVARRGRGQGEGENDVGVTRGVETEFCFLWGRKGLLSTAGVPCLGSVYHVSGSSGC